MDDIQLTEGSAALRASGEAEELGGRVDEHK